MALPFNEIARSTMKKYIQRTFELCKGENILDQIKKNEKQQEYLAKEKFLKKKTKQELIEINIKLSEDISKLEWELSCNEDKIKEIKLSKHKIEKIKEILEMENEEYEEY